MTVDEVISKAEHFAMGFITKLKDASETSERKQVYFMDNQDELRKYMGALQRTITGIKDNDDASDDELLLVQRAESVVNQLKEAIASFQQELTISSDIQEEDATATVTEETISEAMQNNKTTQEISNNMNAIAEQRKAMSQMPQFNYAISCDGNITLLNAKTKEELNNQINTVANQGSYKNIQLFQMQFVPVPLHQKTVLSV
jgi:sugar-specific transcriptional regulator TrmB